MHGRSTRQRRRSATRRGVSPRTRREERASRGHASRTPSLLGRSGSSMMGGARGRSPRPMRRAAARSAGPLLLLAFTAVACGEDPADFYVHGAGIVLGDRRSVREPARTSRRASRAPSRSGSRTGAASRRHLDGRRSRSSAGRTSAAAARSAPVLDGDLRIATADPGVGTRVRRADGPRPRVGHADRGSPSRGSAVDGVRLGRRRALGPRRLRRGWRRARLHARGERLAASARRALSGPLKARARRTPRTSS